MKKLNFASSKSTAELSTKEARHTQKNGMTTVSITKGTLGGSVSRFLHFRGTQLGNCKFSPLEGTKEGTLLCFINSLFQIWEQRAAS